MQYSIVPSRQALGELARLTPAAKTLIERKLCEASQNPFRNKRLHLADHPTFRIRFSDNSKELRLVYFVEKDALFIVGIFERKRAYADLLPRMKRLSF